MDTKNVSSGRVYITAGFNNTIVTITDSTGKPISVGSSGAVGFKGSRKSTPYAATVATEAVARRAYQKGMREISVFVKGPGNGRISAIKALKNAGLNVVSIADITPVPHNGCRPKNRRRV
ncbi:30S ribosomal protein S11 [candidate division WWE3 bacterium]|nr:30S ribosomal protein S11 [candidate division WWE3 bacterium]